MNVRFLTVRVRLLNHYHDSLNTVQFFRNVCVLLFICSNISEEGFWKQCTVTKLISRSQILKMNSDYLTRSDIIYIYSYCDKCVGIICFYKILSIQIK